MTMQTNCRRRTDVATRAADFGRAATIVALLLCAVFCTVQAAGVTADRAGQVFQTPVGRVDNVRVERSPGEVVTISYDLISEDAKAVFQVVLLVSQDGGKTFDLKPRSVTGDVGSGIRAGATKKIVWEAGKDVENLQMDLFRFRVVTEAAQASPVVPAPTTTRAGSLTVSTVPAGANVDVDGKRRGTTPTTVADLAAGSHRVTITRDGYLENSRVVVIEPGRTAELQVTLTAAPAGSAPGSTAAAGGADAGHGGNPLKWILPVVGGGAAVGIALAAKGGGSAPPATTPTTPAAVNHNPVVGTVSVTPAEVGLQSITNFQCSLSGISDADGDAMTIVWTYGDGQQSASTVVSGSASTVTHTYSSGGTFSVVATVTDAKGGATASTATSVVVKNMIGTWVSNPFDGQVRTFRVTAQSGSQLTGTYENTGLAGVVASVTGSVSAPKNITMTASGSGITPVTVTGTISSDMNSFTALVTGGGANNQTLTFTRQ
jgi:hypothetical protein